MTSARVQTLAGRVLLGLLGLAATATARAQCCPHTHLDRAARRHGQ